MNCERARARWHRRYDEGVADPELVEHLALCAACCRYACEMDSLVAVMAELRTDSECVTLSHKAAGRVDPARGGSSVRRIRATHLMRLAAAFGIAVGAWMYAAMDGRPGLEPARRDQRPPAARSDLVLGVSLRGLSAERMLAVSRPSGHPNVEIVWLYSTIDVTSPADRS